MCLACIINLIDIVRSRVVVAFVLVVVVGVSVFLFIYR